MASDGIERRDGAMMTAVIFAVLTVIGAGAGYAVGVLLEKSPESVVPTDLLSDDKEANPLKKIMTSVSSADSQSVAAELSSSATLSNFSNRQNAVHDRLVSLPPIVTTLARPNGKWIRLEGSIAVRSDTEQPPENLAEETGEHILAYLRTVELDHISGPSGFLALRDDLNETVQVLSHGDVSRVLIHGFIVE